MSLNIEQIEDKAKNLVSAYPEDLEDTLVAELIQFVAFMRTQKPASANESAELTMYIIIIIFVYCRLTHATEQKILPQQAEISGIIVA